MESFPVYDFDKVVESSQLNLEEKVNQSTEVISSAGLLGKSEQFYNAQTEKIVSKSIDLLDKEYESKRELRKTLSVFFLILLSVQFLILAFILLFNNKISNELSITYITSVFVETLGIIVLMVKFAFDNSKEVEIVRVLNSFMSSFQKYNSKKQ